MIKSIALNLVIWIMLLGPSAHSAGPNGWQWVAGNVEEVKALTPHSQYNPAPLILTQDHPLVIRLQSWLDRLHASLLASNTEYFSQVPKPIVRIYLDIKPNGFVMSAPTCRPYPAKILSDSNAQVKHCPLLTVDADMPLFSRIKILAPRLTFWPADLDNCHQVSPDQFESFLSYLKKHPSRCNLSVGSSLIGGDSTCIPEPQKNWLAHDGFGSLESDQVGYMATLNVISISSSILQLAKNEAQAVAVLYHEAGHYYRAHATAGVPQAINRFYRDTTYDGADVPMADQAFLKLGTQALLAGDLDEYLPVPGARFAPAVSRFLRGFIFDVRPPGQKIDEERDRLAHACLAEKNCLATCSNFISSAAGFDFDFAKKTVIRRTVSAELVSTYLKLESEFMSCAAQIRLRADSPPGTYEPDFKLKPLTYNWIQDSFFQYNVAHELLGLPKNEKNLAEVVAIADKYYLYADQILQQAAKEKLGYYTVEQDADRLSALWMNRMNVDPNQAAQLYLNVLKFTEDGWADEESKSHGQLSQPISRAYVSYRDCKRYHESQWREKNGESIALPVGSFDDSHHPACYRVQNVDRAIRGLPRQTYDLSTLDTKAWSDLMAKFSKDLTPPKVDSL